MPTGVCSETWILDHPQTLIALQRAYLAAGSEIIYAPTFGANRVLLGHHDLQREVRALNRDLVQLGREAVGTSALLAGDMTTTARMRRCWRSTASRPKRCSRPGSTCSPWRR